MAKLKNLSINNNVTEPIAAEGNVVAFQVTTSEASVITVDRSVDGIEFSAVPDFLLNVDGTDEFNLSDLVKGQYIRVKSTGELTECKVLY